MQQLRNNKLPNSFNDLKYLTKRERPTRDTYMNMAKQYRARTKFSSLVPLHQFPQIWNDLPAKFRDIKISILSSVVLGLIYWIIMLKV